MAPKRNTPALLTKTSSLLNAESTSLNNRATSAALDTSAPTAIASPPLSAIARATRSAPSRSEEEVTATRAPSAPKAVAIPAPIPLDAPVTIATLLDRSLTFTIPLDPTPQNRERPLLWIAPRAYENLDLCSLCSQLGRWARLRLHDDFYLFIFFSPLTQGSWMSSSVAEYATLVIGVVQLCAVGRNTSTDPKKNLSGN